MTVKRNGDKRMTIENQTVKNNPASLKGRRIETN